MASATHSDHLLHLAIWLNLAALAAIILQLLDIFRLRGRLAARKQHEQRFMQVWQPLLALAVAREQETLLALEQKDVVPFLKLWNHLHESLRGQANTQLNIIALRVGVLEHAHALLQQRHLGLKLLALTTLGNLKSDYDRLEILEIARSHNPLLSLTAAHTLFHINAATALHDLRPEFIGRADWPEQHLAAILKETATDEMYALLAEDASHLAGFDEPEIRRRLGRLLRILLVAPYPVVIPTIRRILSNVRTHETLAQCIKFLHEPEDLPVVRTNLQHSSWVVRLQVAKALGRFGATEDTARLAELLSDPVWWVRYRAAQALIRLLRGDMQKLSTVRSQLNDRFAQDALEMAMAERGHS